ILGFGLAPKIVVAAILAFFPCLVNTVVGFRATTEDERNLMLSLQASRAQEFRYLRLRNALPYLFAAFEVAAVLSMLGTITTEFVGSSAGLGYLLTIKISLLEIDSVYALLIVFGTLGGSLFILMNALRRRIVFWLD